jgi:hypothetical protein
VSKGFESWGHGVDLQRKNALIRERQRANRVGGVIDRRFGENDPNLDPEEQMLERFAREKQVQVLTVSY